MSTTNCGTINYVLTKDGTWAGIPDTLYCVNKALELANKYDGRWQNWVDAAWDRAQDEDLDLATDLLWNLKKLSGTGASRHHNAAKFLLITKHVIVRHAEYERVRK